MNKVKRYNRYLILTMAVVVTLLFVVALNSYYHEVEKLRNDKIIHQKNFIEAEEAIDNAYRSKSDLDVKTATQMIEKLDGKEAQDSQKSLKLLSEYLVDNNKFEKLIDAAQKNLTEESLKEAQNELDLLTNMYSSRIKNDKFLSNQILTYKKRINTLEEELCSKLQDINKYKNKKIIALTFDDGPSQDTTPQLLEILVSKNVLVTFFALGSEAEKYPEIVKQEAKMGNEVGSHTWDHKDLVSLSPDEQKKEIESANQFINKLTGNNVKIFRPPYGSYNDTVLQQTELSAINWTIDTTDWNCRSSELVEKKVIDNAHDGAIILLHDIHQWSVDAVSKIIDELESEGFSFVTVDTLLSVREGGAKAHQVYFGK